jgi:hypothetical protein
MAECIGLDVSRSGRSDASAMYVGGNDQHVISLSLEQDLAYYNWIEYSLIHKIGYNGDHRHYILGHYPLIVDGYWYLGFAYGLIPKDSPPDVESKRQNHRLMRQTTFNFTSQNLKSALIDYAIEEVEESRFYVSGWEKERQKISDEVSSKLFACFRTKAAPPHWLEVEPKKKQQQEAADGNTLVGKRLDSKYNQVRRKRLEFHEENFAMIHHSLSKFDKTALDVIDAVSEDTDISRIKTQLRVVEKKTNAKQFKMMILAGAIIEETYPSSSPKSVPWEDAREHFSELFEESYYNYSYDIGGECKLSNTHLWLIYQILENGERHDTVYDCTMYDGKIFIEDESLSIHHEKKIPHRDAEGIINKLREMYNGDSNIRKGPLDHGIQIIANTVARINGSARWEFYYRESRENLVEKRFLNGSCSLVYPASLGSNQSNSKSFNWDFCASLPL